MNKLSDAQSEAGEAQHWLEVAWREGHCTEAEFQSLFAEWEGAIGQLSSMIANPAKWNTSGKPQ